MRRFDQQRSRLSLPSWLPRNTGLLAPFYRTHQRLTKRPRARAELHDFWRAPEPGNLPEEYLAGAERSRYLAELVRRYVDPPASILEIGCNVGRNLHHLHLAGYRNLAGIEINSEALALLRSEFPELGAEAELIDASLEDAAPQVPDARYDLTFSMAALEHIHSDSHGVFAHIPRFTRRYLITIEDEYNYSIRHFPRKYRRLFERLGMVQIDEFGVGHLEGLYENYVGRVFAKARAEG